MDNLLNISLRIEGKEFIECDYIQLILVFKNFHENFNIRKNKNNK